MACVRRWSPQRPSKPCVSVDTGPRRHTQGVCGERESAACLSFAPRRRAGRFFSSTALVMRPRKCGGQPLLPPSRAGCRAPSEGLERRTGPSKVRGILNPQGSLSRDPPRGGDRAFPARPFDEGGLRMCRTHRAGPHRPRRQRHSRDGLGAFDLISRSSPLEGLLRMEDGRSGPPVCTLLPRVPFDESLGGMSWATPRKSRKVREENRATPSCQCCSHWASTLL